jgi:AraC-like DNA-binding protein
MLQTQFPGSLLGQLGASTGGAGEALLPSWTSIRSHSRAEARASVERLFFSHRLAPARDTADVDFTLKSRAMGGTSFNLIQYGVDIDVAAAEDEADRYVLVVPLSGDCIVKYLGGVHDVRPGGFLILKPGAPFDFSMSRDHAHLAVGITRPMLVSSITRNFDSFIEPRNFVFSTPLSTNAEQHTLISFLAFLCDHLATLGYTQTKQPFASILERTFISLLCEFMAGKDINASAYSQADRTPCYVLAAETFIRDNLEENIGTDDIIAAAGVPMRTLYHGFQIHRGTSPLSWMKAQRLKAARATLLNARPENTVTEVAARYYASNLGRFSQQYHREFGEYPSETLRRANCNGLTPFQRPKTDHD